MALTWITWPQLLLISVFTLQMFAVSVNGETEKVVFVTVESTANISSICNGSREINVTHACACCNTTSSCNVSSACTHNISYSFNATAGLMTVNWTESNLTPNSSVPIVITFHCVSMLSTTTTVTTLTASVGTTMTTEETSPTGTANTSLVSSSGTASSTAAGTGDGNITTSGAVMTESSTSPAKIDITDINTMEGKLILIVVPAVGGTILLVIVIVITVVCCRRRKRRKAADEESKALERVTAPNGDLYTQVMVKGRGFQAIEMTPTKASNGCGQEYKRLSMDVPSELTHNARSTKGTRSAIITSIDYESMTELNLGGKDGQAKETMVCRESGEAQPVEKVDEGVRESAYVNPLAEGGNEVEYENCSDFLNVNGGEGMVSKGATETKKSTKTPSSELTIVPLKKNKSPVADKKEKSPKSPSRNAPSTVSNTAEKPSAQDENPAAPGEARPESDVYENASVVHGVKQGSTRQGATPDHQGTRHSEAADDVKMAKEVEAPQSPASEDSSEDWLEDNILYESSRDVSLYMNKAAGD